MCLKAEANACAPEESILLSNEDKGKERKPYKSKSNKAELCCKAQASACAPEEPIRFAEEDKRKVKGNLINQRVIKKNYVVKQKQVLGHLRCQSCSL